MITRPRFVALASLAVVLSTAVGVNADPVYIRSMIGDPFGSPSNENAMDQVFGGGNWTPAVYESATAATLFTPAHRFIFMEGGDNNANALNAFLTSNQVSIEGWVATGGRLMVNAAPNEGGNINLPFGATLNFDVTTYSTASLAASAVDSSHPIFQGPFTPVTTSYTGSYFSHAFITGSGLSSIMKDDQGRSVLSDANEGLGFVIYGGITDPIFHNPQPEAQNRLANTIFFAAGGQGPTIIPEPASISMALMGLAGLMGLVWKRRKKQQELL